jgi:hypothetical protein
LLALDLFFEALVSSACCCCCCWQLLLKASPPELGTAAVWLGSDCATVPADVLMQRRTGGRFGGVFVACVCDP